MSKVNIAKAAREAGRSPQLVYSRLQLGWTLEKALDTPPLPTGRPRKKDILREPPKVTQLRFFEVARIAVGVLVAVVIAVGILVAVVLTRVVSHANG